MPAATQQNGTTTNGPIVTTNSLYEEWKAAPEEGRWFVLERMTPLLRRHVRAVIWHILREDNSHLATELVDDLILDIGSFEGRSKFSTWCHSRFLYRCVDELRYRQRSLGEALPDDLTTSLELETKMCLAEFQQGLSSNTQAVVQAKLEGYTFPEIAEQTGLSRFQVLRLWQDAIEGI